MKINTNIAALIAQRNLAGTEGKMQGSITRLSTGLRINSASDDPAGLIISESMRTQIRGLEQAMRNVQDGINLGKTAEAAMDEVQTLLREIRGLAVHSANSAVVDASQLAANQSQVRSVIDSINRIAEHTSWGSRKLLNGSAGATASITQTGLVSSLYIGSEFNGSVVRTGPIEMTRVTAATRTTTGPMNTTFANSGATVNAGTFVINGVGFTVATGMTVSDVVAMINEKAESTGVQASIVPSGADVAVALTSSKFGSNFPINYLETSAILNNGAGSTPAVGANAVFNVTVPIQPTGTATEVFTGGAGPGVDGLTLTSPSGNRMVITTTGNGTGATTVVGQLNVGSMTFQIGANAEQNVSFGIPSLYARDLGTGMVPGESIATLDLTNTAGAENAIRIIDDAVRQLAFLRGELGSFQKNFLESTVRSLGIAQENLTASESAIRDADIAAEMTEFTKVQILRESGIAVLAQASRAPQSVLKLLQG